jgi:hypothetical protein
MGEPGRRDVRRFKPARPPSACALVLAAMSIADMFRRWRARLSRSSTMYADSRRVETANILCGSRHRAAQMADHGEPAGHTRQER